MLTDVILLTLDWGWIGHKMSGNGTISLSPQGLAAISYAKSVNIDPSKLS